MNEFSEEFSNCKILGLDFKKNMLLWMQKVNLGSQKLSILNPIEIW